MLFDISRVYTALNADELKVGSTVYLSDNLARLKEQVIKEPKNRMRKIKNILPEDQMFRFCDEDDCFGYLAYLIAEPEEKKLKWTDLKLGDKVRVKCTSTVSYIVTGYDSNPCSDRHIYIRGSWRTNGELAEAWEKVEE